MDMGEDWRVEDWRVEDWRVAAKIPMPARRDYPIALLGREPRLVFADGATLPGFETGGETRTVIHLIFDGELRATIADNHHNIGGLDDQYATIRLEGTEGAAVAELSLLKNYPTGALDHVRYMSRRLEPGAWIAPTLAGSWFPDAFVGTMASVMRGLEGAPGAPETAVRDNLGTVRLVLAAYRSMAERRPVDPAAVYPVAARRRRGREGRVGAWHARARC